MKTSEGAFGSATLNFPQPSKPLHAGDYTVPYHLNLFEEERFPHQSSEGYSNFEKPSTTSSEQGEHFGFDEKDDFIHIFEEFVEELNGRGHEFFQKLVSKVENEPRFHKLKVFFRKLESDGVSGQPNMDRGVNVESSTTKEDIREKLERFKVKTINLGGIVNEQPKK